VGSLAFGPVGARVLWGTVAVDYICSLIGQLLIIRAECKMHPVLMVLIAVGLCYVPLQKIPFLSKLGVLMQALCVGGLVLTGIVWSSSGGCSHVGEDVEVFGSGGLPAVSGVVGLFVGIFCVHTVMPVVYQNLQDKSEWPLVLRMSGTMLGVLYMAVGVLGYFFFGNNIGQVYTKNLGHDKFGAPLGGLAFLAPASGVMIMVQTLTCVPAVARSMLGMVESRVELGMTGGALFRIVIIGIAVSIAVAEQKFFAYMVAFRGAFVDAQVCIGIPILAYLVLCWGCSGNISRTIIVMAFIVGYVATSFGVIRDFKVLLGLGPPIHS
jgi:hypothetical protein